MRIFKEGAASIKVRDGVFYNPKMEKLRSISVLFLRALSLRDANLLDSTSATAIRAIRYCLEAGIKKATAIDMNLKAAENSKRNAESNKVKVNVLGKSMQEFANTADEVFDAIDIDPFGSPVPLIHDAFKISKDGTIFMVTATDTATLCGAEGQACQRIYGSRPLHNELCHEAGVRILINFIAREAGQFNFGIEPMLSLSDMHYLRVFLRLKHGSDKAVKTMGESGFGGYCPNCHAFSCKKGLAVSLSENCYSCGSKTNIFGPLWLGKLQDKNHINKMLNVADAGTASGVELIRKISEELDIPFFYSVPKMTAHLGMPSIPIGTAITSLREKFEASRTHFEKDSIKTTADVKSVAKSVMKAGKR